MRNGFSLRALRLAALFVLVLALPGPAQATERLRLATTTSTDNSGLLKVLHPPFERENDVVVDVIAVGTGKALKLGENGDVDVVLVHAPAAEKAFVDAGFGIERQAVMHNDFVLIGPASDPAGLKGAGTAAEALKRVAAVGEAARAAFVSRGDESGTHKKEKILWKAAHIHPNGAWYLSVGQGMGAVLQIADDKQAYTLTDRGTYLAYHRKISLPILVQGDPALYNPYHVILVNPARHPEVKVDLARKYAAYLTGPEGQGRIRAYQVDGQVLFYPDVLPDAAPPAAPGAP
jgi:tungstate transport system substrate-binding protein